MTDAAPHVPDANPGRGREVRADGVRGARRRRRAGTLNRMAQFRLDIFEPEMLDTENYVYRWVSDAAGRLRMATKSDDYDFVATSDLNGFNAEETDSESTERVRILDGKDENGHPIYSYLLRKPRDYFESDMEQAVQFREDMMDGRVYRGEVDESYDNDGEARAAQDGQFYVPKGEVRLGSATARRRGPITRKPK